MASVPTTVQSVISGSRFSPGRFWTTRLATFLGVFLLLYGFHNFVNPKLGIYDVKLIFLALIYASLATSLNLINGVTGQFSIGHAAFYLIGAITSGKLSVMFYHPGQQHQIVWLLFMVLAGAFAAAIAGLVIGLPSLRLRGDYLAVATLGFGEIINVILRNQDGGKQSFWGLDLGGAYGLQNVPKLTQLWSVLALLIFTLAMARNLLKSAHGLSFLAVREDELAADATGVSTTRIKVTAFVIGAALAGMAGALFAHYNGSVSPDDFKMDTSFMLVAMVVIGGTGSITGAAVAGICMKLLEEGLRKVPNIPALSMYGFIIAGILVFLIYRNLSQRGLLKIEGSLRPIWSAFGSIVLLGLAWGGYRLLGTDISWVLKSASVLMIFALLVALFLTPARNTALPRFGALGVSIGLSVLITPLFSKLLHGIGPLETLIGATVYSAPDLRWAVFSAALVMVMILKPTGLMGHREYSWSFAKQLFTGSLGKGAAR